MRWALAIGYAVLITIVSSIPSDEFPVDMPLNLDKAAHAVEYAILAFLVCRAVRTPNRTAIVIIAFSCIAYGIIDELHQLFIAGRDPSVWDVVADAAGSTIVAAVWRAKTLPGNK